jgi:hypothetical protein
MHLCKSRLASLFKSFACNFAALPGGSGEARCPLGHCSANLKTGIKLVAKTAPIRSSIDQDAAQYSQKRSLVSTVEP